MATETLDSTAIVEFKYARSQIKGGDDNTLTVAINAASLMIEAELRGTLIIQRTVTEDYSGGAHEAIRGGSKRIHLRHGPCASVTSITDDNSDTVGATDYTLVTNENRSVLEHETTWPAPDGRWTIIYTGGYYASRSAVPWNLKQACILEVKRFIASDGGSVISTTISGRAGSRSRTGSRASAEVPGLLPMTKTLISPFMRTAV